MLAYDYPLLGVFWTMMIWFLWVAWLILLFRVIADIFRSRDLGGVAKALWAIFVVVAPWLGVLLYLVIRGRSMTDRDIQNMQARDEAFRAYVQDAAGSGGGAADELTKLADLKAQGLLTDAEFDQQKAKLLA